VIFLKFLKVFGKASPFYLLLFLA